MFKRLFKILKLTAIIFICTSFFFVLLYKFVPVYCTPLMLYRVVEQTFSGESIKLKHKWVSIDKISKDMQRAVIASEDQLFFDHNGFNFKEIKNAIKENKKRKKPRGASTISQQTAKNVFLWHTSSWVRKGFESYFTTLIEIFWSKERILEIYLNSIEMGKGIYGVEAVANNNFNTTAKKITSAQAALIAATLPNPIRFNSANPSRYIINRQQQILKQMRYISLPK